jgi:gluconolactonase
MDGFACLVRDIPGAEGPCTTWDGRIFMVAPKQGLVLQVLADGTTTPVANTGGIPAGLQLDRDGTLLVADMKLGILRVSPTGEVEKVVTEFEGAPIRGCNDLAFDSVGNLYFTAPAGSSLAARVGELFCFTNTGTLHRLDHGFAFCNGIAVSEQDGWLYVAETWTKRIYCYKIDEPGRISHKRIFATLPGGHTGGPDGIDFDSAGNLLCTNWGGGTLEVVSPDGRIRRRVELPFDKPSNVHFAGPDSTHLLITEHSTPGLWSMDFGTSGQCQYGWRTL